MKICLECSNQLSKRHSVKYCSNKCQRNHIYSIYIARWKLGKEDGARGISTKSLSKNVIRYVFDKYNSKCAICDWNRVSPYTNNIMLEVDHIDGNSENNSEENLILLCPNCHSLTKNYKNLNKGHGRLWRREKYVKIV